MALVGSILSGPVALAIVGATHPQPSWSGPETFAAHFHRIQTLPFFFGLLMVAGFVVLVGGLRDSVARMFTSVFAALVFLNYVIQTTFVPELVRGGDAALLSALTMTNPRSLAWGLEMWGYGFLGVATWIVARKIEDRVTSIAFVANGVVSVVGAFATALSRDWLLTTAGLAAFGAWNLLVVVMCVLVLVRRRTMLVEATS